MEIIENLIEWSEIWILLFPLFAFFKNRMQPPFMQPVLIYLFIGFFCNIISVSMMPLLPYLPKELRSNTLFYNIHSLARFICFVIFFFRLEQYDYRWIQKILVALFTIIFIIYFSFFDSFFNKKYISSDMMSGESFFLLFFCMLYYLSILKGDTPRFRQRKDFWVVTGICLFDVLNFFIFLFYKPLLEDNAKLADQIWTMHNIAFIIFILFITKAIYVPDTNKH
jgi:hypothetical protein